jgi:uncharacterized protein YcaQ
VVIFSGTVRSIEDLRRFTVARSLTAPTSLKRALDTLGFVQADPIRAPARAQDLTLRHRVTGYRAGDLERRYVALGIEEDFFVNYGFVTRAVRKLMHPRPAPRKWAGVRRKQAEAVLDFIRARTDVSPKDVNNQFAFGSVTNYWGGQSLTTTHLLDAMHYRGLLRVARRADGIRIYAANPIHEPPRDQAERRMRIDALVDVAVRQYAPLPGATLSFLVRRLLQYGAPQWYGELAGALKRAKARFASTKVGTVEWFWPPAERLLDASPPDVVRLLTPFDPLVWDRRRFELLWGWTYRFEAYTPVARRQFGYYALPLLWRDRVIGWANADMKDGTLRATFGYVQTAPRDRAFARALDAETERLRAFLVGRRRGRAN